MARQNFIEINGKKYDTVTGKLITDAAHHTSAHVKVVDGFTRRPNAPRTSPHSAKKTLQKASTLNRTAVKKPATASKVTSAQHAKTVVHKPTLSAPQIRVENAKTIQRSPSINKFGKESPATSFVSKVTQQAPPAPVRHSAAPKAPAAHTHPSQQSKTEAMLDKALAQASAHTETFQNSTYKRRNRLARKLGISPRAATISAAVLSGVLIGGFFAIQHVPNLAMRIAATRAGFSAAMPGYQPSGFAFSGPISYTDGQVVVSFTSNTDNRRYNVIQKDSNWNSDALLDNYVIAENKQYQTYQDRGRTLYIYDGSNATWVDNGIWYRIEGESDLTTDQIIRIAASI